MNENSEEEVEYDDEVDNYSENQNTAEGSVIPQDMNDSPRAEEIENSAIYITATAGLEENRQSSSKFSNIVFKQDLRSKGRPKKRTKQLSFKRTVVDRKSQSKNNRQRGGVSGYTTRKKVVPSITSSDEADESEMQLDDDSDDDLDPSNSHEDTVAEDGV